ncbi:uncharacterized protein LOC119690083 [Teleopsis dalmanni]|uniref:uncharacterized protein LOC119690083 n=1 Tax=Teleopsis dalmanni TaxID=139649 RepID=UPI0018CD5E5A|nr:uncharacterized protein LOC119690083 [Teleopsis dalmanni]
MTSHQQTQTVPDPENSYDFKHKSNNQQRKHQHQHQHHHQQRQHQQPQPQQQHQPDQRIGSAASPNLQNAKSQLNSGKVYLKHDFLQFPVDGVAKRNFAQPKPHMQHKTFSQTAVPLPNYNLSDSYATLPLTANTSNRAGYCRSRGVDYFCHFQGINRASPALPPISACTCTNSSFQQYQRAAMLHPPQAVYNQRIGNGCHYKYEHENNYTDDDDSIYPKLLDQEFRLLHHNVPALRRTDVDISGIRQYFYPDGGWGWIVCGVSFLIHILSSGFQLSYGLLMFYAADHLSKPRSFEWLGALSWAISTILSPFVVTLCERKLTRLLAVVGGLVLPLGILFTSFATELEHIIFSYGIIFGIGVAMVRESSTIMLGNYFKRRRQFVEMVAMSGEGVGIALFSVILKEGVGKTGWRLGLQIIAAMLAVSFFIGLIYRPASLYHPQRRAIQHLKNQRRKVREKGFQSHLVGRSTVQQFFLDISLLKSTTIKVLLMISGIAALGLYTPMFLMSLHAIKEGSDIQDIVLLQTFLGLSTVLGVILAGSLIHKPIRVRRFTTTTQLISQIFISTVAIAILFLSFVMGYRGLCILSWIYGIGFGGFRYSFKMLALERIKHKHFSKTWGVLRGVESVPVLISVPLTSFLNDYSLKYGRAGYYICSAAAAIAGIIIFFINYSNMQHSSLSRKYGNGAIPAPPARPAVHRYRANCRTIPPLDNFLYSNCELNAPDLLNRSCISLNQLGSEHSHVAACGHLRPNYAQHIPASCQTYHRTYPDRCDKNSVVPTNLNNRKGKRLQKSLSFIHNSCCCEGRLLFKCYNNCHGLCKCARCNRTDLTPPLLCTCNSTSFMQNSRSQSVPEGLSSKSQQCMCKPSTQYLFVPKSPAQSQSYTKDCCHSSRDIHIQHRGLNTPGYFRQRSKSLSKPIHLVEQITTSV